jgi:hypothetical protein
MKKLIGKNDIELFLCDYYIIYDFQFLFRGDVVTMECVEKILKKDWIYPLDNTKLTENDIIPLQRVILQLF